jgi:hypothetical protein
MYYKKIKNKIDKSFVKDFKEIKVNYTKTLKEKLFANPFFAFFWLAYVMFDT